MMDYTVVVPTKNRPDELIGCLKATLVQSPKPAALLVIDDGNLDEDQLRRQLGSDAALLRVARKDRPGSVPSLNLAGELCQTTWFLVLDDDIYLDNGFMAAMGAAWDSYPDKDKLAALSGYPILTKRRKGIRSAARLLVERLFLINGYTEGRFLPSSYFTDFECGTHPDTPWRIEHIPGGLALWRTEIFRKLRYDEWYEGYAYGADMELGWRCSRHWHVICVPDARAMHDKSPRSRIPTARLGEQKIRNQWFFFRRHYAHSPLSWICFLWATFGHIALLTVAALTAVGDRRERFAEVGGMIRALLPESPQKGGRP